MAVRIIGLRSCRPEIETTLRIRPFTVSESGEFVQAMRVARWPPAEWPVRWIGPPTMPAIFSTA
jgi:hypothetical protein